MFSYFQAMKARTNLNKRADSPELLLLASQSTDVDEDSDQNLECWPC